MKITFGTNGTLTHYAGMDNRAVSLANHIINRNKVVSFFTFINKRDDIAPQIKVIEYTPFHLSYDAFYNSSKIFPPSKYLFSTLITKQLRNINPDIVCVDYPPMDWYAAKSKDILNFKLIYTYHTVTDPDLYSGQKRKELMEQKKHVDEVATHADMVVAVSDFARQQLLKKNIKSVVIFNGVDTNFFRPNNSFLSSHTTMNGPILLHVGRLVRHKGLHLLIKAFKTVKKEMHNTRLYIVGVCEDEDYLHELYKLIGDMKNSVFFLGDIGDQLLPKLYSAANLFVCASLHEGFGMPFLEAQSCGTPCIGFNTSAIPEIVINGKTGILVEKGNIKEMADATLKLLTDNNLRKKMGEAARKQAEKFDWGIIADQFSKRLEEL